MKWSWKIARIAGIDVYIHTTFLLLIGWIGFSYWIAERSLSAVFNGILFVLALFVCVVLHEFGHALTARRYGITTRDITLLPIGGVARLERMPEDPRQELWVSLAGPAVNIVIALFLLPVVLLTNSLAPLNTLTVNGGPFFERLLLINLTLAAFNLIPAFPMDGGRVLRALLASRMEYTRATQTAASIGQGLAFLIGFIGLFTNPFLLFVALFVWIGAAQENSMVQFKSALGGIPVSRAMLTEFHTLSPYDRLSTAVERVLSGWQQDFPVVQDGQVVGILTRQGLLAMLSKEGGTANVLSAMQRDFFSASYSEMLDQVAQRMQGSTLHTVPVLRDGQLIGLLTMDNLGEFMMIQAALREARARGITPTL